MNECSKRRRKTFILHSNKQIRDKTQKKGSPKCKESFKKDRPSELDQILYTKKKRGNIYISHKVKTNLTFRITFLFFFFRVVSQSCPQVPCFVFPSPSHSAFSDIVLNICVLLLIPLSFNNRGIDLSSEGEEKLLFYQKLFVYRQFSHLLFPPIPLFTRKSSQGKEIKLYPTGLYLMEREKFFFLF